MSSATLGVTMGLLLYPFFAAAVFVFWAILIATVVVVYLGACLIVFLLTGLAMLVRSPWRPRQPSMKNRHKPGYNAFGRPAQARRSDRR